jgi:RNA polymerase sigma factor (sigma-70 family)
MAERVSKVNKNKMQKENSLLRTAFDYFTTKGFSKTSISDIVEKAGVAKGTFYLYFKDKYDIRNRLIAHKSSQLFKNAFAELEAGEPVDDAGERIIRIVDSIVDQLEANQDGREAKWIGKHPEIPDDKNWMLGGYCSFEDALLNWMMREEMLKTMTDKQRQVYLLYHKYGYNQREIGKKMGMSQESISRHLSLALKKVKKFYQNNI